MLTFNQRDFIFFSGDLLLDETFSDILDSHILRNSSLTVAFQEFPLETPKKDSKGSSNRGKSIF